MTRITGPIDALARYARVMHTPLDMWRYMRLRHAVRKRATGVAPVAIRVRTLGGASMLCRPSRDVWTFKHTFLEGFHMPPLPLREHATIVDLGSTWVIR